MRRKNRRPAPSSAPTCTGVDINRNYDWMWYYPTYFDPQSGVVNSTAPCSDVYIGTGAFSEPETQNAQWLMDAFPAIGYFIDVHSFGDDILYSWGDDDDQSTDPAMNFRNAAYDGKRGVVDSTGIPSAAAYREYIPTGDKQLGMSLANRLNYGIQAAHGRSYTVKQACNLYPTAGTSDDYAYARHFVNPAKGKVLSYTLEWGPDYSHAGSTPHWTVPQCFHPTYSDLAAPTDMTRIIEEVTSGILEFCLGVVHPPELPGSHHVWELVARILFGIINDGDGLEWLPGRGPVPVDPWGPVRVAGMAPESRDALIGLAMRELGRGLGDEKLRDRVEELSGRLVGQGKRIGRT
jgi:hypothetical protein